MLYTYNQTLNAEKNYLGWNFLPPKSTAKFRWGSSENIKPINRIGSISKACQEKFPRDVKISAKQSNMNQTFDLKLLGIKSSHRNIRSQKGESRIKKKINLLPQAVYALAGKLLSAKAPKIKVSLQYSKRFLQKTLAAKYFCSSFGIFFGENHFQIVYLAHHALHGFGRVLLVVEEPNIT